MCNICNICIFEFSFSCGEYVNISKIKLLRISLTVYRYFSLDICLHGTFIIRGLFNRYCFVISINSDFNIMQLFNEAKVVETKTVIKL